jgi:hypothetical protein
MSKSVAFVELLKAPRAAAVPSFAAERPETRPLVQETFRDGKRQARTDERA